MTTQTLPTFDPRAFLAANTAAREAASRIDTSRTESVTAADLRVGDVVLSVGATVFPFPFTLSAVQVLTGHRCVVARAVHGWFTTRPIPVAEQVVRVVA